MKKIYCSECDSCGHEPCCPATNCIQSPSGKFCKEYLLMLKKVYFLNDQLLRIMYEDKEKYKELISFYEQAYEHYEEY